MSFVMWILHWLLLKKAVRGPREAELSGVWLLTSEWWRAGRWMSALDGWQSSAVFPLPLELCKKLNMATTNRQWRHWTCCSVLFCLYLLGSSLQWGCRAPSCSAELWPPGGPQPPQSLWAEQHSSAPSPPCLWAGTRPPNRFGDSQQQSPGSSRSHLRCLGRMSLDFWPQQRSQPCGSGCSELCAALPGPRRTAGSFWTLPPDTPAGWGRSCQGNFLSADDHQTVFDYLTTSGHENDQIE